MLRGLWRPTITFVIDLPVSSKKREYILEYYTRYKTTRMYSPHGYILGVLTHTTAWDRNWGVDETLKLVLVYVA